MKIAKIAFLCDYWRLRRAFLNSIPGYKKYLNPPGCLQCCLIFHCKVRILPSTGYGDCFVSLVLCALSWTLSPRTLLKEPSNAYIWTPRIRTIHQMSIVPSSRSPFSGNWSIPLTIITANWRSFVIRIVSATTSNLISHDVYTRGVFKGHYEWLSMSFCEIRCFLLSWQEAFGHMTPLVIKKTAMTIWETIGKHRPTCDRISGHT